VDRLVGEVVATEWRWCAWFNGRNEYIEPDVQSLR
jgi:hypothetical protein